MTQAVREFEPLPPLALLLQQELATSRVAQRLDIPELSQRLWDAALGAPLSRPAALRGKDFRGQLVTIAWQLAGGRGEAPGELSAIIEALHLGSLIIDDIEDGSTERRGAPALHHTVGLPVALNTGNWLYFWPMTLISRLALKPDIELELRRAIDRAVLHCHYGQALDLTVRVTELRQREVTAVVFATTRLKTGSLMDLAARVGAIAAGGDHETVAALGALGRDLGVALQMLDDLSGVCDEARCHKGYEDLLAARPTWLWAWLAESGDAVAYCRLRALGEAVVSGESDAQLLAEQLRDAVTGSGQSAIRELLTSAVSTLGCTVPEAPSSATLKYWIQRLLSFHG
jgi:geranylgeranyl pyrophosphate synthase